jgi:hypothetical protein
MQDTEEHRLRPLPPFLWSIDNDFF